MSCSFSGIAFRTFISHCLISVGYFVFVSGMADEYDDDDDC